MAKQKFRGSELSRLIDETILEFLNKGEPSADEVSRAVLERYGHLVAEYSHDLSEKHIHEVVSTRMKKTLATRKEIALQLGLDILFKGLEPDSALSFRDDTGKIHYVATVRATDEHHKRYIELLRKQVEADVARLRVAEWFFNWLKPVFDAHPGITTAEAIVLFVSGVQAA